MKRWKWLSSLSCVTSIYSLAAFSKSRFNWQCRMKIPLLPNKCLIVLLSLFHWREVITGPYESEMNESKSGWMGGHSRRASWEWGRINSSPGTDGGHQHAISTPLPSPPPPVLAFTTQANTKVWGRSNFRLKRCSKTVIRNTYIWKPIGAIDWNRHYEEIGQVAWVQKATWACPPFGITPDLCNCKGKPLFEWVNIVITELLWNHAFLTRRADFSPHTQIAIFISVSHKLQKLVYQTKVLDRQTCSQSREDSLLSKFPSERHSMSACVLTVSLSVSVSRTCTRKLTQALSLTEQGLFGYDFNPSIQH